MAFISFAATRSAEISTATAKCVEKSNERPQSQQSSNNKDRKSKSKIEALVLTAYTNGMHIYTYVCMDNKNCFRCPNNDYNNNNVYFVKNTVKSLDSPQYCIV
uniref:Uncharacterized protein n=1 Tax=Bactrocera latifrons TaxID=174628 RepID=A0A0K8VSG0_BACLA